MSGLKNIARAGRFPAVPSSTNSDDDILQYLNTVAAEYGYPVPPPNPLAPAAMGTTSEGSRRERDENRSSRAPTSTGADAYHNCPGRTDELLTQLAFDGLTPLPLPQNAESLQASLRGHVETLSAALEDVAYNGPIVSNHGTPTPFYPPPAWATQNGLLANDVEAEHGMEGDLDMDGDTDIEDGTDNEEDDGHDPEEDNDSDDEEHEGSEDDLLYDDEDDLKAEDDKWILFSCPRNDATIPKTRGPRRSHVREPIAA